MSGERLDSLTNSLGAIRAGICQHVEQRLNDGATLGTASKGRILAVSHDPLSGERQTKVVGYYRRPSREAPKSDGGGGVIEDAARGAQFVLHSDR